MHVPTRIEPLENRIAPAGVTVTYRDIDGDLVKISDSSGNLTAARLIPVGVAGGTDFQLGTLDLSDPVFAQANISITVSKGPIGDGLVAVGYINATGVNLGAVKIAGDLGAIDVGNGSATEPALKSLTVRSMGLYGTASGAPDLESDIKGALGALTVATDVKEAFLNVRNGLDPAATLGAVKIGGSLIGGLLENSGLIRGFGGIGSVTIGGDIVGGAGDGSGSIFAYFGEIGKVTIGGSVLGGLGTSSGELFNLSGGVGAVQIGGNLRGDLGLDSGKIDVKTNLLSLKIGGSILGGAGRDDSYTDSDGFAHFGQVYGSVVGAVTVAHDVHGGTGAFTGAINGSWGIASVTIGGSLIGGSGALDTGLITSGGGLGAVKIAHDVGGDLGGGRVHSFGEIASVTIGGSLIGGSREFSGAIDAGSRIGPVKIGGDVLGGIGVNSGYIVTTSGNIVSVTIGGSLVGGTGEISGGINAQTTLGPVKIGGDLLGANLAAGSAGLVNSGFIYAGTALTSVAIEGSIIAGIDASSAGDVFGGATIRAGREIGSITVKGDIAGNDLGNNISTVVISAYGQLEPSATADVAIGRITVGGRVELAKIFAGYDPTLALRNADAQIGTVAVGGDWIASDLVAGVLNRGADHAVGTSDDNVNFGDDDDVKISGAGVFDTAGRTSKIGSVAIAGRLFASVYTEDPRSFGFVAEEVGALKIGGYGFTSHAAFAPIGLTSGAGNDYFSILKIERMALHELGATFENTALTVSTVTHDASTITYEDSDGDGVTVKLSQPLITDANVDSVFKFGGTMQLQEIDLSALTNLAPGLSITVSTTRGFGDGLADIGHIKGGDFALGAISISGDLGSIDAVGAKSLKVGSLGRLGLSTSGAFATDLMSTFDGPLGALTVGGDVKDAIVLASGAFGDFGTIGPVKIGGSVIGGQVYALHGLGAVKIAGSVQAGRVWSSLGEMSSVTIGGSLIGGTVEYDGSILGGADSGAVKIAGNVVGGLIQNTGLIRVTGTLGATSIGGSVIGAGLVSAGDSTTIKIAHNLAGPAAVSGTHLNGVTVSGSLIGGSIFGAFTTGAVKVTGNVFGGSGSSISAESVASITIGGSLVGGTASNSGEIYGKQIGAVKISHDFIGGSGINSGALDISSTGVISSVTIGGSLIGGAGGGSGSITGGDFVGSIKIGHDLLGASLAPSAATLSATGSITTGHLGSVAIGGSIVTGLDASSSGNLISNASIRASRDLGSVSVAGSLLGRATSDGSTPVIITAVGQVSAEADHDIAIGKLSVGGIVSLAKIEAGFNPALNPINGNAQIGAVSVKGNWLAANLLAGIRNYGANHSPGNADDNLNFGNADDHPVGTAPFFSKIASITIGGIVAGTAASGDHFGFVANVIGKLKTAGFTAALAADELGEMIPLAPITGDVAIHEATA